MESKNTDKNDNLLFSNINFAILKERRRLTIPSMAEESLTDQSFGPRINIKGIIKYVGSGGFQSPKERNETGKKFPCSSAPVLITE